MRSRFSSLRPMRNRLPVNNHSNARSKTAKASIKLMAPIRWTWVLSKRPKSSRLRRIRASKTTAPAAKKRVSNNTVGANRPSARNNLSRVQLGRLGASDKAAARSGESEAGAATSAICPGTGGVGSRFVRPRTQTNTAPRKYNSASASS